MAAVNACAYTGSTVENPTTVDPRLFQIPNDLLGYGTNLDLTDRSLQQHGELVSSESSNKVVFPDGSSQALRYRAKQHIPSVMTESVVYLFELVDIDEKQRKSWFAAVGPCNQIVETLLKEQTVRQLRKWIVIGRPPNLPLS